METQPQTEQHTLLFVDDEENILNALRRIFRKEPYRILTTTKPQEGLDLIKSNPVSLVLSDHRMPEMEGTEFLSHVQQAKPYIVRIMLTGYADIKAAVNAINQSQVYRFISKPWNDDDLRITVREALRQYDLVILNRELTDLVKKQNQELSYINRSLESRVKERTRDLEEKNTELVNLNHKLDASFVETIQAFVGLMELKSPTLVIRTRRVAHLSQEVAVKLGMAFKEAELCEVSALLMDIGLIGYPDHLLNKSSYHDPKTSDNLFKKHTLLGEVSLKGIEKLERISSNIRSHHEQFDGKGYPDGLREENIPLHARIIAVVDFFDSLIYAPSVLERVPFTKAQVLLKKEEGKRFDPSVVEALMDVMLKKGNFLGEDEQEEEVPFSELTEGMTLARDLKTRGGILIIPGGTTLRAGHLQKIINFRSIDPVGEKVYVLQKGSA